MRRWTVVLATLDKEGQPEPYRAIAGPFWLQRSAQRAMLEMCDAVRSIGFPTMLWLERR